MSIQKIIVPELVPQRLRVSEDFSSDVWRYGYYNTYPQQIMQMLFASGITSGAVSLFQDFIYGEGFEDKEFGTSIINDKGQTANDLLSEYVKERSIFNGAAFHVNYNMLLEASGVVVVPFQYCRLGREKQENKIAIYDNWAGESYDSYKTIMNVDYLDIFTNNPNIIERQIGDQAFKDWKGQILYTSEEGFLLYPRCTFDPVINDVQTDALYSTYRKRAGQNNFSPSVILDFMGDFEEADQRAIRDGVKNFQGSENSGNAMMFFGNNTDTDGKPVKSVEVNTPSLQNFDSVYVNQERSVNKNITRLFKQPSVLNATEESGLFNQDQMEDAYTFYNEVTKKQRSEASRIFEKLFSNFHESVNPSGNFKISPSQYGGSNVTEGQKI